MYTLPMTDDPLITIAAAARAVGVTRQTLHRQMRDGVFPNHDGFVRLSEVQRGRRNNLDPSRRPRRGQRPTPQAVARGRLPEPAAPSTSTIADRLEMLESSEWLVMNALAHSEADPIHLDFFETTISRNDARALIAAYRAACNAIFWGGAGEANLRDICDLHVHLGVDAGE